jgi:hypothetical protein
MRNKRNESIPDRIEVPDDALQTNRRAVLRLTAGAALAGLGAVAAQSLHMRPAYAEAAAPAGCIAGCTTFHTKCVDYCNMQLISGQALQDCYHSCSQLEAECVQCCNAGGSNCVPPDPPDEWGNPDRIPALILTYGTTVPSSNFRAKLKFQVDGNLVVYDERNLARWASHTVGLGHYTAFQQDGNLVVYNVGRDGSQRAVWASNTCCRWGSYLSVQDDGNVVVYDSGNHALWATHTNH